MQIVPTKEAYEALCDEIWRHNRLYFQEASPEIEDEHFDELVRLLEKTELAHPEWISPTSPSQRIGEEALTGFAEVAHKEPMLSLEKAYEKEELVAFYERVCKLTGKSHPEFYGELKMDGIAISITYEKGKLVQALTRGNGAFGSDITQNCKTIKEIPLRIDPSIELLEVRGEVFIPTQQFIKMNQAREKEGLALWANPRNAAAGSLKLLDAKELAKREGLSCVVYGIAQQKPKNIRFQSEVFPYLRDLGLPTYLSIKNIPIFPLRKVSSVDEMIDFAEDIRKERERLPFGIDGVVFKLNSLEETAAISPTLKHPRTAIAWKFSSEKVWTTLLDITCNVGRTGVITPTAELEPVEVMGSVISRATLHNADEISRKDIRPGDRVLIEKGGDVIPKVVQSDHLKNDRQAPWKMETHCPSCQTPLVKDADGVFWRCPNHKNCPEQRIRALIHFVSKDGLDIENIGEKLIRALYENKIIQEPSDIFHITKEKLLLLEGIQEKSASNIFSAIQKAKHPPFAALLMALGLRHVGKGTAAKLTQRVQTIPELLDLSYEDLTKVEGIGDEVASSLIKELHDEDFKNQLTALYDSGVIPQKIALSEHAQNSPFYQKQLVFTGSISISRNEAKKIVESLGGSVSESVSKKTDFVIVGDDPGSKVEKAKKLGIPLLTNEEFLYLSKT